MIPIYYFNQVDYFILEKNTLEIKTLSCLTSKIWEFKFELRPSKVNSGQNYFCCSKAHIIISYSIFDFNVLRVWPLTSKSHLGLKKVIPFESPYMTSYLTSMETISLSCTVFELFDFEIVRVWPWLLTSEGHLGSQKILLFESSYMTSYLTSIDNISLSRTVFEIFDFKVFMVWPWPLTPKSHLGSKKFIPFESTYMTSYLTSMDTISLSRTVLEIFDFKVFRFWPWPSTPKDHLGSRNCIPFESPYMTSYSTSMDTISLSRTVLEIFDFKLFRVWPWPLTPENHLESKFSIPFESPYMNSYLTSMNTISLSRTVSRDIRLQSF